MIQDHPIRAEDLDSQSAGTRRRHHRRMLRDRWTSRTIAIGGIGVILTVAMIFIFLLYEVAPLFKPASVTPWTVSGQPAKPYPLPGGSDVQTLYLGIGEHDEMALRVTADGQMIFFRAEDGTTVLKQQIDLPAKAHITAFTLLSQGSNTFALGLSNGQVKIVTYRYRPVFDARGRHLVPIVEYPLGTHTIAAADKPITQLALTHNNARWNLVTNSASGLALTLITEPKAHNHAGELHALKRIDLPAIDFQPQFLRLSPDLQWLMIASAGTQMIVMHLGETPHITQLIDASTGHITQFQLLLGGSSLLVGDDQGRLSQWFFVRQESGLPQLTHIRDFSRTAGAVTAMTTEQRRKGFATVDANGGLSLYYATADRRVYDKPLFAPPITQMALSPRADALLVEHQETLSFWRVDNPYPEVSWSALWDKVWYEHYPQPAYVWQSSAANSDFEPKYSLMPLMFGTLKAAFYAMVLGTPLALLGAIYTAYFMAPRLRRKIKPTIELMEAMPTVVLGFLAGLWLAPFMADHLGAIFSTLIIVPLATLLAGFLWQNTPAPVRRLLPDSRCVLLLIPVIAAATWLAFTLAPALENLLFDGSLRIWLSTHAGIPYDQRNALIVGIAMGFAVIPTIYSIAEDAIFAVPRHLSYGSLALGATRWQTMIKVVLPTASPGIFSALMIGLGRAVGETMIVLMATGNTPIMDASIFDGMRTLAANIAVEIPESEVGSTHFRILFLTAFLLFVFTFIVNTIAEMIRQHLRRKYGSL